MKVLTWLPLIWSYFKVDDEPDKEVIQQQTTNNYHPQFDIIKCYLLLTRQLNIN